jgi:hypothetical protein
MNQPIINSVKASMYVQEREQIQTAMQQKGSSTSFAGIDVYSGARKRTKTPTTFLSR